jgi:hypothetical protein
MEWPREGGEVKQLGDCMKDDDGVASVNIASS